jgi:hypothetical protein
VPRESKASSNVDINVLSKTLFLKIKHIYNIFQKPTTFFTLETKKFQGFNKIK